MRENERNPTTAFDPGSAVPHDRQEIDLNPRLTHSEYRSVAPPYSNEAGEVRFDYETRRFRDDWRSTYEGRGPKGYQRRDDRIRDEICESLTDHPEIDVSDVEIEVEEGVVRLFGTVPEKGMKWRIEETVEAVLGVLDIENRLKLERRDSDQATRPGR